MRDEPVRVLHVGKSLGLGGTEKAMQLFVTHLDRNRFLPAVFSPRDGERGAQIREAGIETFVGCDLPSVLERFNPTIAHVHRAGWTEPETLEPFRVAETPVVVETNVFGRYDPSPSAAILDRTMFISNFCAERFASATGISTVPPRYSILYYPVDTDFFAEAAAACRDFTLPFAGRISRADAGKWSWLALDILPMLVRDVPGFRYHVIGGIPEAYEFVRTHGLERSVVFHDQIRTDEEIARFLDGVSLLAHANATGESFGLVIAEAMACSLPVVTHPSEEFNDNAQVELVEHGRTGLVAATAEEYANAVKWLFAHPKEAKRMGEAGREKAAHLFRAQTIARQLEAVYDELLELESVDRGS